MCAKNRYRDIKTRTGAQLYDLLPEVYRNRDSRDSGGRGDLAKYLDACGELLDLIRNTLEQRLADSFPDDPGKGRACQPWLLPYFAQLVDARLVSPDEQGRREEVANAVSWRQRKGTGTAVEQIAQAVGRIEVEVQEGWKRVATTPRLNVPLLPAQALGEPEIFDHWQQHPGWASRHPGLPAVTVDFRFPSRAVEIGTSPDQPPQNPAARLTDFGMGGKWWRQANPHGVPCFPDSYEDVSPRTVDMRTPDWRQGHYHHRRILLYMPPPTCFFQTEPDNWQEGLELNDDKEHTLENQVITQTLKVTAGSLKLVHCMVEELVIQTVPGPEGNRGPLLTARDCIIGQAAINGPARLEFCTLTGDFSCSRLQASDSIFTGNLTLNPATPGKPHCIRYSRIPEGLWAAGLLTYRNTSEAPVFYEFEFDQGNTVVRRKALLGEPGLAVLHPATPDGIRFGAEDGGEMGAYHIKRYCLLLAAVQDKLGDFLPVGMEAVLIPDLRLLRPPFPPCGEDSA